MLDVEGDAAQLGKATGADRARNKPTYPPSSASRRRARRMHELHARALAALAVPRLRARAAGERLADWLVARAESLNLFTVDSPLHGSATPYPLLTSIDSPADLRALTPASSKKLADELRQYLIETVSQIGGHFAAGLGVVELTVALHYVFDTPDDRLVWDVGHQAIRTRSSPAAATSSTRSSRRTASRRSRSARKASTTPSASAIRPRRSPPRSAWRSPPRAAGDDAPRRGGDRRWRDDRGHGVRGAEPRRRHGRPTCWSSSTTTTCRSPRTSARCPNARAHAVRQAQRDAARRRQETAAAASRPCASSRAAGKNT